MRTTFSSLFDPRARQYLAALGLLLAVSGFGCYKDPKVDVTQNRHCQSEKNCPYGLICGPAGFCCTSTDGKACVGGVATGGSTGSQADGAANGGSPGDGPRAEVASSGGSSGLSEVGAGGAGGGGGSGGGIDVRGAGGAGGGDRDSGPDSPLTGGSGGSGGGAGGITGPGGTTGPGGNTASGGITAPGGRTGSGGIAPTGGTQASGGTTGSGGVGSGGTGSGGTGSGGTGSGGTGSGGTSVSCTGTDKLCGSTCIGASECCGGCSGTKPVCDNGTCVGKANGATCTAATAAACDSGICADDVCCDDACEGNCESCNQNSHKGTCWPSTTARTPCASDNTDCGGKCDGTTANRKNCYYPTTQCAARTCQSGVQTNEKTCDGAGKCAAPDPATKTCAPYTCDGTSCGTACGPGQDNCGGSCVPLNTAAHCGSCTNVCSAPRSICTGTSCVQCTGDGHCSGTTPVCNTSTNTCVVCLPPNSGCPSGKVCSSGICVECGGPADCAGRTDGKHVCYGNKCVQCTTGSDCSGLSGTPDCNTSTNTCVECTTSTTCRNNSPSTPVCVTSMNACKECNTSDSECSSNSSFGPGAKCNTSSHECQCRPPTAGVNILPNPGFQSSLSGWQTCSYCSSGDTYWDSGPGADADGCTESGSLHTKQYGFVFGEVDFAVSVASNYMYRFAYRFKQASTYPNAGECRLAIYTGSPSGTTCPGTFVDEFVFESRAVPAAGTWSGAGGTFNTSTGTCIALMCHNTSNPEGTSSDFWFDQIFLGLQSAGVDY
jgi:hypothetical protein